VKRSVKLSGAAALAVLAVVGVLVAVESSKDEPARRAEPRLEQQVQQVPGPTATIVAKPKPAPVCDKVPHGFAPKRVVIPGITKGASVMTPPRDANNIPGTPPLTTAGKSMFAWDTVLGTRPGDKHGNVAINAHAWPDHSALGDQMVANLHKGDRVVVEGDKLRLCYRVTERVEVPATSMMARYYETDGPPRLAILTCSGTRLGPGVWTKRTVWFASPAV
jgi:hypothetical protein